MSEQWSGPPDWIPDDPEGHRWVSPPSPDCPNCDCCTEILCSIAKERDCACVFIVGSGVMDVRKCPCAPMLPPLGRTEGDKP